MYRNRSIDIDGKETFSDVKSPVDGNDTAMMKVAPTFSKNLTVTNLSHVNRIDLVELNGRIYLTKLIKTDKRFPSKQANCREVCTS